MNNVISFHDFYFGYYKQDRLVLEDINLNIREGSFTVISGPSGAGKTTLCKAMAGIVPYYYGGKYHGDVFVLGESTQGKRVSDLAMHLSLMMEDYESQLVSLTVGEEIAFCLLNHGFPPDEVINRTKTVLEAVGLPGRENYQLDELSGGQKQRLLLASLLAVEPKVLVLDEPVSAMDPEGAQSLYALVAKLQKKFNMTVVVVEHNLEYVLPYVTDLIVLDEGRVVTAGLFSQAAFTIYNQPKLRAILPDLWQVKFHLEAMYQVKLGEWHTPEDARTQIAQYFQRSEG